MANLKKIDKTKHKYVVGIDFGHGETSAAICKIEWDKDAGKREASYQDIDLDIKARKKVITSAICRVKGDILTGDEAFEHMTDNNGIRIGFKQKPESLDGKAEILMIDFMKDVYEKVRESWDELDDVNHIVYIARPSGWVEPEVKELYKQMALKAGIPLAGLTSESRAAIFYAKEPNVGFAKEISSGAIVFDLGSSTLDFTYLSDASKPIDYGYNRGASIIDEAILENMILSKNDVNEFVKKYPQYYDALKFKARKFKEDAYSRDPSFKTNSGFALSSIIAEGEESYDDYENTYIPLKIKNLHELNDMVNASKGYIDGMAKDIEDFKDKHIPGKKVNGVFLTGGASRMNFIRPLVAEHFGLPEDKVKIDKDNPSLTISRGIALLGTMDAITDCLVTELEKDLPKLIKNNILMSNFINTLSSNIATRAWDNVASTCEKWVIRGKTTDIEELQNEIEYSIKKFQSEKVHDIVNNTLQDYIRRHSREIRERMNEIISKYAPGREIPSIPNVQIGDVSAIKNSLENLSSAISEICDSISSIVSDVLWAILGVILWGVLCAPYYIAKGIYHYFREDEDKRRDKVNKLLKKKDEVISDVEEKLKNKLNEDINFKNAISSSLNDHFNKMIKTNLAQVKIPIE